MENEKRGIIIFIDNSFYIKIEGTVHLLRNVNREREDLRIAMIYIKFCFSKTIILRDGATFGVT